MRIMSPHTLNLILFLTISLTFANANQEGFIHCISNHSSTEYVKSFKFLYKPGSPSYTTLLQLAEQNPRWLNTTSARKPKFIVTLYNTDEIRASIVCSKRHEFQVRVKSGGHDYEGLSYVCGTPFVIIDLINLQSISIDLQEETAWVQTGATMGELYYSISQKSSIHGFPGGHQRSYMQLKEFN